jgi:hypothetical protein
MDLEEISNFVYYDHVNYAIKNNPMIKSQYIYELSDSVKLLAYQFPKELVLLQLF